MKHAWAVALVLCLVASGVWADVENGLISARSLGMGTTAVGVADDASAWGQNPAGLAALNVPVMEGKVWGHDLMGTFQTIDEGDEDEDFWGITWSGWDPARRRGIGAGYGDAEEMKVFGAGYGQAFGESPASWGLSIMGVDPDGDDSEALFNVGFLYGFEQPEQAPIRLGLTVTDITDEFDIGPQFNIGVCWPATPELKIAADVLDITDESDEGPFLNAGAEYMLGEQREWALRAGVVDTDDGSEFTAGVGWARQNFRIDAAFADIADGLWAVSGACSF